MSNYFTPAIAAKDHSDQVTGYTIVCGDDPIRSPWVFADGAYIVFGQFIPTVRTFVKVLFPTCGPATVFRRISSIVVLAFESPVVFWTFGPWPHIDKKIGKDVPAFADCDASAAIIRKGEMRGVIASLVHIVPNPIFWSSFAFHAGRLAGKGS